MWIRSQDLYTLIKCEYLSVRQCGSKSYCVIGDERIVLGEYSSLDKAMKVLNDIESHLESYSDCVFCMEDNDEVGEDHTIEQRIDGLIRAYQRNIDDNCKYIENTGNNAIDLRNENSYFEQFIESLKYAKVGEINE